nr:immunoglobulin heavy chain junction region [Macaca mulatta]
CAGAWELLYYALDFW